MKRLSTITFLLFIIIHKPTIGQTINSKSLRKYSYLLCLTNDKNQTVCASGFFLKYFQKTIFVTAKHCLFDAYSNIKRPDIKILKVYKWENSSINKELIFEKKISEIIPYIGCYENVCADVCFFEVALKSNDKINYVNLFPNEDLPSVIKKPTPLYIVGFPVENGLNTTTIVQTELFDYKFLNPNMYLETPSKPGASGAPVFFYYTRDKKYYFIGSYWGKDKDQNLDILNKAGVVKSHFLLKSISKYLK